MKLHCNAGKDDVPPINDHSAQPLMVFSGPAQPAVCNACSSRDRPGQRRHSL